MDSKGRKGVRERYLMVVPVISYLTALAVMIRVWEGEGKQHVQFQIIFITSPT